MEAKPISFRADAELMAALDAVPRTHPGENRSGVVVRLLRTALGLATATESGDRQPPVTLDQVMARLEALEQRMDGMAQPTASRALATPPRKPAQAKSASKQKESSLIIDERKR